MNNFVVLHAIVTQLMQSIGSENALIILKIQLCLYKYVKLKNKYIVYVKLKNHPLSKAYRHVVCVPGFVSAF